MAETKLQAFELADVRPPLGEYFYINEYCVDAWHERYILPACFVCGEKATSPHGEYQHLKAIAQCMAAGRRIAAMFKPESCYVDDHYMSEGGVRVTVSTCKTHTHHLEILRRLMVNGIITLEHVSRAERAIISRHEFGELVAKEAHEIWWHRESTRSHRNWCDAWELSLKELGRIPSQVERKERARLLCEERKAAQAVEDWLTAEKKVSALYTVAT